MAITDCGLNNSTNVRSGRSLSAVLDRLAAALLPASPAAHAALDFLTPPREVAPPMLPEPAGGSLPLAVPDWPAPLNARLFGSGNGAAPAVLLLHGWGGQLYDMADFVEPLVGAGYRVVAFDAPAHGRSAGETAHLPAFARAAAAVAKAAGPLAGAIGHSMGAAALALAASDGLALPRLALLAPPAAPLPFALKVARAHRLDTAGTSEMLALIDRASGRPVAALELSSLAPRIPAKALFLHATGDRLVPVGEVLHAAAAWRGASVHLLDGLGHRALLRDPETVAAAAAFFGRPAG